MYMHTYTHSFTQSHTYQIASVSSCGFKPSVSTVRFHVLCYLLFAICFFGFFFYVCLSAGAPDDSLSGFHTEAVGCLLFTLSTDVAARCPVLSCFSHCLLTSPLCISVLFLFLFLCFPSSLVPLSGSVLICMNYFDQNK